MPTQERRNESDRRLTFDRRKGEGSMISALSGYDGPERRVTGDRRDIANRRH